MKNCWMDSISYPGWWKVMAVWGDIVGGESRSLSVCLFHCLLTSFHESEQTQMR